MLWRARDLRRMKWMLAGGCIVMSACSSATGGAPPIPPQTPVSTSPETPDPIRTAPRAAHPGFDTRVYPGEAALRAWRDHSPYEWVGYYLLSPCQKGTTWVGKRAALEAMGYGTAVVFIGEQDWPGAVPDSSMNTSTVSKQCTVANLTPEKGAADAARADSATFGEGFPAGTTVFLDVERVENVSPRLEAYVRAWVRGMMSTRYAPGLYVHERNAAALRVIVSDEMAAVGRNVGAHIWVASRTGFDISLAPAASGFPFAATWQGSFNVAETWGGVTLTIDANVSVWRDPSRGQ